METTDLISGRYRLGDPIGRGGMATIYRAADEQMMERPVAVKVLREVYSNDPKFVTRFQREARAASALNHPNIVQVFDYGQSGDSYYIVMEFIDGMDLRRYIKRAGVLTVERGVRIARDISLGLGAAHKRGIVHRDVKPQNVMVTEDGIVKLTDFGIASMYKDADAERLTTTGMTLGTVQYYAPEQAQGEIVRPSADIYALGIVMYEMLTGQTPFDGDTPVAVAMKHIQEQPQPPSQINPRIPPNLERIILRCLSKEPQARYRDGDELAAALEAFLRAPNAGPRRPVPSGPYNAVGPMNSGQMGAYGASNPNGNMPRGGGAYGQAGPRSGPGGMAPTGGPNSGRNMGGRPPMSVNGRPGMGYDPMDERTVEDFGAYDQPRGFNASVGVATPPPNTNPWITPDTKPRWPGQQQPGDQPPPKRNTALWGAIIAVVLVILVAGGFLTYEISQNAFTPTATATETKVLTYTLPDFKGKTCDDARAYIAQQHIQVNLTCNPKTDTSSSPVPVDTIFDQSPAAGTTVNAGSAVTLYYNPAPNTVPVPAVPTNPYMSWTDFCTKVIIPAGLGCHPGNYVNSDIVPAGDVIDTTPAAGTSVAPGTTVNVNISIGPVATPTPTATVPVPTPTNTCLPTGTPPAC